MNIAIIGATGLIGTALAARLSDAGHTVTSYSRTACRAIPAAQSKLLSILDAGIDSWVHHLADADIVINCVGVFANAPEATQQRVHVGLVEDLAGACKKLTNLRLIHFSALAADENGTTAYATSKGMADRILTEKLPDAVVLRPSLVFSSHGTSTKFLAMLAQMPVSLTLHDAGEIQPIFLDDLVRITQRIVEEQTRLRGVVEVVGPRKLSWQDYFSCLRFLGPKTPLLLPVSVRALENGITILRSSSTADFLNVQSLRLLQQGSHESGKYFALRGTTDACAFMDQIVRSEIGIGIWRKLSIATLCFLWAFTALVSLLAFPTSLQLASMLSNELPTQQALVVAGVVLDAAMALMTWTCPSRRLWRFQMAITLIYSIIIAIAEPAWLMHPFGPVTKNLVILLLLQSMVWTEKK